MKRSHGEKIFDAFLVCFMVVLLFFFLFPILNVIALSFNEANDTSLGGVFLWPRKFTLRNYEIVFQNDQITRAYLITISRTVLGTVASVFCTGMFAYAMSKKKLMFRNVYFSMCVVTMFFSGGLIPSVVTMTKMGFSNNYMVYIIPGLYGVMNMLIMKTFFQSLPASLEEAALIDGANDFTVFTRVVIPSSMPVISTIALMVAVGQWNSWFDAYIYMTQRKDLFPVQYLLQRIVLGQNAASEMNQIVSKEIVAARQITPYSVQLATLVVSIGPIVFIYPFFQRYFIKGFMLGAIKE